MGQTNNDCRGALALAAIFVAAAVVGSASSAAEPEHSTRPTVVAHRGLLRHAPENTLANFRAALELGVGFEFDVRRTRDGVLVCVHDDTVDRTTDGTGRVADLAHDELKRLDAGSWFDRRFAGQRVPTVKEVLSLLVESRAHPPLVAVDLKSADVAVEVAKLAEQLGVLDQLIFIGATIEDAQVRAAIASASPRAHAGALANNAEEFPAALAASDADWVYVRFIPTREQLDGVHAAGKRCFIAGPMVSGLAPENWRRAAEVGIDAILTDYSLELSAMLRGDKVDD